MAGASTSRDSSTSADAILSKTYNNENVTIGLPDDIDDLMPLLRCDRSTVEYPNPFSTFDYSRFSRFLQLYNALERQNRFVAIRKAQKIPQLEDFTDEVLNQELRRIYGEMDTSSSSYTKIFQSYKEERLEEIAEWIEEEDEYINVLLADGIKIIDLSYEVNPEDKINIQSEFTSEEFRAFSRVGQGARSGVERFILPRKELKTVGEVRALNLRQDALNLAIFDPQISLPTFLPDRPSECTVPQQLTLTLQTLIRKHPTGISLGSFLAQFREEKHYDLDYMNLGYTSFGDMITDLHHIIWAQPMQGHQLQLYPTYLKGLTCTPRELFWKILHRLQFILTVYQGILSVKDAFELSEQMFGFKFYSSRLKAWGFSSVEDFAHFLFKEWPHHEIKLKYEHELKINSTSAQTLYIIRETKEIMEELNKQKKLAHPLPIPRKPHGRSIPDNCIQIGHTLDWEMDVVPRNKDLNCILTHYVSPVDFNVVLADNWLNLENLGRDLAQKSRNLVVNPSHLCKGMYFVAEHESDFLRVRYLERIQGSESVHKVFSIDYGNSIEVNEDKIMYLLFSMAYKLLAQSISCCLYNVLPPKNSKGKEEFDKSTRNYCYDILFQKSSGNILPFLVSFRDKNGVMHSKEMRQFVRVCGPKRSEVPDAGKAVMEYIKKNCSANTFICDKQESQPLVSVSSQKEMKSTLQNLVKPNVPNTQPEWKNLPSSSDINRQTYGETAKQSSNFFEKHQPTNSTFSNRALPTKLAGSNVQGQDKPVPSWIRDRQKETANTAKTNQTNVTTAKPSWACVTASSSSQSKANTRTVNGDIRNPDDFPSVFTALKPRTKK